MEPNERTLLKKKDIDFYVHWHWFGEKSHAVVFHSLTNDFFLAIPITEEQASMLIEQGTNHGS